MSGRGGPLSSKGLQAAPCVRAERCTSKEASAQQHATAKNNCISAGVASKNGTLAGEGRRSKVRISSQGHGIALSGLCGQSGTAGREVGSVVKVHTKMGRQRGASLFLVSGVGKMRTTPGGGPLQAHPWWASCSGCRRAQLLVLADVGRRQPGEGRRVGRHDLRQAGHDGHRGAGGRACQASARQCRLRHGKAPARPH